MRAFYSDPARNRAARVWKMDALLQSGRPLECLGSDRCNPGSTVLDRVTSFIYALGGNDNVRPSRVEVNDDTVEISIEPSELAHESPLPEPVISDDSTGNIVMVALGERQPAPDTDDREMIGWSPSLAPDEVSQAARMWWVMNPERASTRRYLVAWARENHRVVGVWVITSFFAQRADTAARIQHRCGFEVTEPPAHTSRWLRSHTQRRIDEGAITYRNPVSYL